MNQNPTQSQRITFVPMNRSKHSATGESWWTNAPQANFTKHAAATVTPKVLDSTNYLHPADTEGFRD